MKVNVQEIPDLHAAYSGSWSTDSIVYARTALPVNVVTGENTFRPLLIRRLQRPAPGSRSRRAGLDLRSQGRRRQANQQSRIQRPHRTGPRLNGFGATEVHLTLRRQFKLYERLSLQARADFFNIFTLRTLLPNRVLSPR